MHVQREFEGMWRHEKPNFETRNKFKDVDVVEGVLTRRCFETLLSKNHITFPTISEDEINDKSKGDALSKGIAYLQLAWFIVQIITRAVQGLAISELELTTAALAGLNSAMYLFWWSKPLDVRCPIVLQTKGVQELSKDSAAGAVHWEFSESEFRLRKHMWNSITRIILNTVTRTVGFVRSLPKRIDVLASIFKIGLHEAPKTVARLFEALKQTLSRRRLYPSEEWSAERLLVSEAIGSPCISSQLTFVIQRRKRIRHNDQRPMSLLFVIAYIGHHVNQPSLDIMMLAKFLS